MSKTTTQDPAERKREYKKVKERERRAEILESKQAMLRAGMDVTEVVLTPDQRRRAVEALRDRPGLAGKSLKAYIVDGTVLRQQVEVAKVAVAEERSAEQKRKHLSRSTDPKATDLAMRAKALSGLRSNFLPKQGREFLDKFTVVGDGIEITVTRTDVDACEATIDLGALEAFARNGAPEKAVRAAMTTLSAGTKLWGRKLALMILVTVQDMDAARTSKA